MTFSRDMANKAFMLVDIKACAPKIETCHNPYIALEPAHIASLNCTGSGIYHKPYTGTCSYIFTAVGTYDNLYTAQYGIQK